MFSIIKCDYHPQTPTATHKQRFVTTLEGIDLYSPAAAVSRGGCHASRQLDWRSLHQEQGVSALVLEKVPSEGS